jgi:2-phosphoglycerate kinase
MNAPGKKPTIYVTGPDGARAPFSKGLISQSVMVTGIGHEQAWNVVRAVQDVLHEENRQEIASGELDTYVAKAIAGLESTEAAERFLEWTRLRRLEIPLIVLVGGATGTGKTTLVTQIASRFAIARITSTDAIREVMRELCSPQLVPQLYRSSYDVPAPQGAREEDAVAGFLEQSRQVGIGVRAVVGRALKERTSVIVEGVHLHANILDGLDLTGAAVVQVMLTVPDPAAHHSHFIMRDVQTAGRRPAADYLPHFPRIRAIHEYLVTQALAAGHEIVDTTYIDRSLPLLSKRIIEAIRAAAEEQPAGSPGAT